MDQCHVKGIENQADMSVWLNGPTELQTDEEKWPKPSCQMSEVESEQANSPVATESKLDPIHQYRSRILGTLPGPVPTTYFKKMMLPLYSSNNQSNIHWRRRVSGHRIMSRCSDEIHCETWLPNDHNQRQGEKTPEQQTSWNYSWTSGIKLSLKVTYLRKKSFGNSIHLKPHIWWNLGRTGSKLQEGLDCNLGQPNAFRQGTEHNKVSCRANTQRKTPDSNKWRPWTLDGTQTKSYFKYIVHILFGQNVLVRNLIFLCTE